MNVRIEGMRKVRCGDMEIVAPLWKRMEPPDCVGQHVRHFRTHRNVFVRELGPEKMAVYCPDKNTTEYRWKTAFYKVPGSHISVTSCTVNGEVQLRATTEENGLTTTEDAYYCEEQDGSGFIWCTSWKLAGFGGPRFWKKRHEDDGHIFEV